MNLKKGTSRLAILLGVGGAIFCGFLSFAEMQSTMRQASAHRRFERLASSQVVQEDRKNIRQAINRDVPVPTDNGPVTVIGPDNRTYHFPDGTDKAAAIRYFKLEGIGTEQGGVDDPINRDGIKSVRWTKSFEIASIETMDGQTLYPTPVPSLWSYVLIATIPVLGFISFWVIVRAIGWVLAGFLQPAP